MTAHLNDSRAVFDQLDHPTLPEVALNGTARRARWERAYRHRLQVTDALIIVCVLVIAHVGRFGFHSALAGLGIGTVRYVFLAVVLAGLWYFTLSLFRSRDERVVGSGPEEYQIVVRASTALFGALAIFTLLFQWQLSRGHLAIVFSVGPLALLIGRKAWRNWLYKQRARGGYSSHVLVVGGIRSGRAMALDFEDQLSSGYRVRGVWIPDQEAKMSYRITLKDHDVPVFGIERSLADVLEETNADTVAVTNSEHLGQDGMRELAWDLGGKGIHLLVTPSIVNFAGPRIHMRSVANRPIIKLEEPQYRDAARIAKTLFDKGFAVVAIVLLSPLLLVTAIAVGVTSSGPIIYRSERIGVGGGSFNMLKFRTMIVRTDRDIPSLLDQSDGAGPLFKMKDDPRLTRVGKILRRFSVDELPQLFNVLKGEMSIVGPRPPLRREVELYEELTHRRLLVRQGLTGLWQVSGRSDLSWEDSIRLDLDYVENWSMMRDLQIIWKTIRAVIKSEGAY